jgi:hypothetical protein
MPYATCRDRGGVSVHGRGVNSLTERFGRADCKSLRALLWSEPRIVPHSKRYIMGISGVTDKGPNFTGPGLRYQWLPRSEVAGRFCPTDQAGARPKLDIRSV